MSARLPAKKAARKATKKSAKKAAKRAKPSAPVKKPPAKKSLKPPPTAPAEKLAPVKPSVDIHQALDEIKKKFLEKCPRCASAMKNTFINLGANQRLLVNQCRVCKFYLPS